MNKLLSAASAVGMLLAVNAAQAGDVLTAEQMDTVTAGACCTASVGTGITNGVSTGTYTLVDTPAPNNLAFATISNNFTCLAAGCMQVQKAAAAPAGGATVTIP